MRISSHAMKAAVTTTAKNRSKENRSSTGNKYGTVCRYGDWYE